MTDKVPNAPVKVIAVGDNGVGKSCIITRFVNDKFNQFNEPTLGAAFLRKKITLPTHNEVMEFHIWDTAGQEKYKSIAPIYYRQAKIAICVYDICSIKSFQVLKKWVDQLHSNGPKDIVLAVVGNKIDRYDDEQVPYTDAKTYAESIGAMFKLVSAKQGKNINELFKQVGLKVQEQGKFGSKKQTDKIKTNKQKQEKCC